MNNSMELMNNTLLDKDRELKKLTDKLNQTSKLANETKSRLDSEIVRITNISDSRVSGLCSLKSKVTMISDDIKETKSVLQNYDSQTISCVQSITDLRKRISSLEKTVDVRLQ